VTEQPITTTTNGQGTADDLAGTVVVKPKAKKAVKPKTPKAKKAAKPKTPKATALPDSVVQHFGREAKDVELVESATDPRARPVHLVRSEKAWFIIREILTLVLGPLSKAAAGRVFAEQRNNSQKGA